MSFSLSSWFDARFFKTGNNAPLTGGKIYTYLAGTTTPVATYSNDSGTTNTNPIILDADGRANIYLDDSVAYRFILKDANDVTQNRRMIPTTQSGVFTLQNYINSLKQQEDNQ